MNKKRVSLAAMVISLLVFSTDGYPNGLHFGIIKAVEKKIEELKEKKEEKCFSLWSVKDGDIIIEVGYYSNGSYPQVFALHKNDGAMRLTYLNGGGWGTSVYPLGYWHNGYVKGIDISGFSYHEQGSNLVLELTAFTQDIGTINYIVTLYPPEDNLTKAKVEMAISNTIELDNRPVQGEAFQLAVLASMNVDNNLWDAKQAYAGEIIADIPDSEFIFDNVTQTTKFGLIGGTSEWKENAPTIEIISDRNVYVQGWVTSSTNPNDDNIGMWGGLDEAVLSWSYEVKAIP